MRKPSLVIARAELTRRLEQWLELPLTILAAVWPLVEFLRGKNRAFLMVTHAARGTSACQLR